MENLSYFDSLEFELDGSLDEEVEPDCMLDELPALEGVN